MIYEKPKNEIFASDAKDGEIVEFPSVKRGWGVTENLGFIPPMEYFNAAFNRVDKSIAYQLQRGVGEWDKDLEYPIGAVVGLNGIIYIAKSQNTNKNPANEAEIWDVMSTRKWSENQFAPITSLPSLATETKAGIVKLKNSITAKEEDAAVTERAVSNAIEANKSIGVDQTWQDVTSQRKNGIVYTNTTGRPIMVAITTGEPIGGSRPTMVINGSIRFEFSAAVANYAAQTCYFIIPNGMTYKIENLVAPTIVAHKWLELR